DLFRRLGSHPPSDACTHRVFHRGSVVVLRLENLSRHGLWLCGRLPELSLAEERRGRLGGPHHAGRKIPVGTGDRLSFPGSLRFDGVGGVWYLKCFPREPLRTLGWTIPSRSG